MVSPYSVNWPLLSLRNRDIHCRLLICLKESSKCSAPRTLLETYYHQMLSEIKENSFMAEAVIVSAVRTPIGRAGKGVLKDVRADDLAAVALRAAAERVPNLDTSLLEDVILGCAFPEGEQGMNLARIATALAGLPIDAGGTTVNRFCASSLQAVNMAAQSIMLGQGDLIIAGGVESMSRVPMGGFNPSFNPKLINNEQGI